MAADAERAVAERGAVPGWRHLGWHGTTVDPGSRWPDLHPEIDVNRGEGFGFHFGTMDAAIDRVASSPYTPYMNVDGSNVRLIDVWVPDDVRIERVPDLLQFDERHNWLDYLDERWDSPTISVAPNDPAIPSTAYMGDDAYIDHRLPRDVARAIRERLDALPISEPAAPIVRDGLLSARIPLLAYENTVEAPGSTSYVALDPGIVRWGSRAAFDPARRGRNNLLAAIPPAGAGGALALLEQRRRDQKERA